MQTTLRGREGVLPQLCGGPSGWKVGLEEEAWNEGHRKTQSCEHHQAGWPSGLSRAGWQRVE